MKLSDLFEYSTIDYEHNELIKKTIRKYANDPHKIIDSAIGLVYAVYQELGLDIPNNMKHEKYDEFNDFCIYATKELNKSQRKGVRDDRWKITKDDSPWH
jgi:hypothetical protein